MLGRLVESAGSFLNLGGGKAAYSPWWDLPVFSSWKEAHLGSTEAHNSQIHLFQQVFIEKFLGVRHDARKDKA